jgi:hypothetical protein
MVRGLFFFVFFILTSWGACGQTGPSKTVGLHASFGDNQYIKLQSKIGGGSHESTFYLGTGIDFTQRLSKHWDFCTGIAYTFNRIDVLSDHLPMTEPFPDEITVRGRHASNVYAISIPILFKVHFWRYFFANGGASFHFLSTANVGVGPKLGVGFECEVASRFVITVNPYAEWVISEYHLLHQGVQVGVGYQF